MLTLVEFKRKLFNATLCQKQINNVKNRINRRKNKLHKSRGKVDQDLVKNTQKVISIVSVRDVERTKKQSKNSPESNLG